MKKLFTIALAALALAACKNTAGGGNTSTDAPAGDHSVAASGDVAFIRMDSLVSGYNRYKDLSATFEGKATKTQSDLEARARRLENEMADLNTKASKGLMTRSDIEATQTQIQTRAQQFDNDRQTQLMALDEEQAVMTNQVMYAITEYVAKFNADYRYKMIVTTSGATPVIHADPSLDITAEILRGLNEEYAAEKKTAGTK